MKKIILSVLVLMVSFPCAAQWNKWFKSLRRSASPRLAEPAALSLRSVQGKKLPVTVPFVAPRQLELEKFIAHPVRLTPNSQLSFATTPHSLEQHVAFSTQYQKTMQDFQKFKTETTPFLYYRLKEPHKADFLSRENQYLLPRVFEMEKELMRLSIVVDAKEDEPLSFALEYVIRVRDELSPMLKGTSGTSLYFNRTDRVFEGDEFYLHEPELKRWTNMLRRGRALMLAHQLPGGLRVAVLNDRESVLEQMEKSHQKGIFIRGGTLEGFSRAEELIAAVRAGKTYDIILTDVIVPGGGAYYLTNVLRLDGFSGTIIALSAFERDDSMGMEMFRRGMDGMINLPIGFEYSPFWESDVIACILKHLRLSNKNKWLR